MRIRSQLLLIAALLFIPGLLGAIVAVEKVREGERQAALRGLSETVRATALLVEGEIQRSVGALTALGQSDHLRTGNLQAFYEQAMAVNQPPNVWTLLFDETGAQLLNTAVPYGTPPPEAQAQSRIAQTLTTQRLLVTDLNLGRVSGKMVTTLYLPARTHAGKRYVVAQAVAVDHWKRAAMQPQGRDDWIVAVIDRNGRFIARNHGGDGMLGSAARPELVAAAAAANDGLIRHSTLENVEAYDAFTHSKLTGWTIAVAAPVSAIEASATQAVGWLVASAGLALAATAAAALYLGRTFVRVIESASEAARRVGQGEQPEITPTSIQEVNMLFDALQDAGRRVAAEQASREQAEAERSKLLGKEMALREAAQNQNAAKDQFLALLGHELRNPLAAISGATAMLASGRGGAPAQDRFLQIIQRQNRHLTHIVDDLLEVSRLMSGKITLDLSLLNLADCVRHCVDSQRAADGANGYELRVVSEDVWVKGDLVRLEQIVNNLTANSLKYSAAGSVVRLSVRARGDEAVIEVSDTGSGIAAEFLPHVFEPFVQGPPLAGRLASGLGIGLALVKQLTELHGGSVSAYSAGTGRGATFTVCLPRVEAGVAGPAPAIETAAPRRILLVEDNADAMESMLALLEMMGHAVVPARDGDEALAACAQQRFDLVLMDVGLPGRSGYEIATELRRQPGFQQLPLIALTGYGQASDRGRALAAGFDEHLVKPVQPATLARTIGSYPLAG